MSFTSLKSEYYIIINRTRYITNGRIKKFQETNRIPVKQGNLPQFRLNQPLT